jgi:hypothetical protein
MSIIMQHILIIATFFMFLPTLLYANDSTARIGAGGITLLKNENIRMLQEDLEISTRKIRVRYRFINESDQDIKTTVVFPLPDYKWNPEVVEYKELIAYQKFCDFKNWSNGKLVTTKRMRKAMIGTNDVTDKLRKIGLTDKQIFDTFGDTTTEGTKLTKKQETEISRLFLTLSGKKSTNPDWVVSESIHWEQLFPKGAEIEVVHEYTPNTGKTPNYLSSTKQREFINPIPKATGWRRWADKWTEMDPREACLEESTKQSVKRKIMAKFKKASESGVGIELQDVEYILGTGKNWKGPIGKFTLRIKKDSPDQLISLCFPGQPKQVNPKTIEFYQTDYTPQDRLVVYFISVFSNL